MEWEVEVVDHLTFLVWTCGLPVHRRYVEWLVLHSNPSQFQQQDVVLNNAFPGDPIGAVVLGGVESVLSTPGSPLAMQERDSGEVTSELAVCHVSSGDEKDEEQNPELYSLSSASSSTTSITSSFEDSIFSSSTQRTRSSLPSYDDHAFETQNLASPHGKSDTAAERHLRLATLQRVRRRRRDATTWAQSLLRATLERSRRLSHGLRTVLCGVTEKHEKEEWHGGVPADRTCDVSVPVCLQCVLVTSKSGKHVEHQNGEDDEGVPPHASLVVLPQTIFSHNVPHSNTDPEEMIDVLALYSPLIDDDAARRPEVESQESHARKRHRKEEEGEKAKEEEGRGSSEEVMLRLPLPSMAWRKAMWKLSNTLFEAEQGRARKVDPKGCDGAGKPENEKETRGFAAPNKARGKRTDDHGLECGDISLLPRLVPMRIARQYKQMRAPALPPRVHVAASLQGPEWSVLEEVNEVAISPEDHGRVLAKWKGQEEGARLGLFESSSGRAVILVEEVEEEEEEGRGWAEDTKKKEKEKGARKTTLTNKEDQRGRVIPHSQREIPTTLSSTNPRMPSISVPGKECSTARKNSTNSSTLQDNGTVFIVVTDSDEDEDDDDEGVVQHADC